MKVPANRSGSGIVHNIKMERGRLMRRVKESIEQCFELVKRACTENGVVGIDFAVFASGDCLEKSLHNSNRLQAKPVGVRQQAVTLSSTVESEGLEDKPRMVR